MSEVVSPDAPQDVLASWLALAVGALAMLALVVLRGGGDHPGPQDEPRVGPAPRAPGPEAAPAREGHRLMTTLWLMAVSATSAA